VRQIHFFLLASVEMANQVMVLEIKLSERETNFKTEVKTDSISLNTRQDELRLY